MSALHWSLIRLARDVRDRAEAVDALVEAPLVHATRASYRRFLCNLYGYLLAYEARFAFATFLPIAFIAPRVRSGRIAEDLLALGIGADEMRRLAARCEVPPFDDAAESFGWIFVVERLASRRHDYREQLAGVRELAVAGRFVGTADGEIEQQWDELGRAVERTIGDDGDAQRSIRGARAALACLEAWLLLDTESSVMVDLHARSA